MYDKSFSNLLISLTGVGKMCRTAANKEIDLVPKNALLFSHSGGFEQVYLASIRSLCSLVRAKERRS